jgi:hypothetical protein
MQSDESMLKTNIPHLDGCIYTTRKHQGQEKNSEGGIKTITVRAGQGKNHHWSLNPAASSDRKQDDCVVFK